MTNAQAEKKARKLWGDRFAIRAGESFSSPERRKKGGEQYQSARAEIETIEADIKQRLSQLDWYQELRARQKKLRKVADAGQSHALYSRYSVGKSNGMFFEVLGSGDTWEEAFEKATRNHS